MSLQEVWDGAHAHPFQPVVGKSSQFLVGFSLLLFSLVCMSLFGIDRSLKSLPLYGVPASVAFGFGAVFMICAVGVYV